MRHAWAAKKGTFTGARREPKALIVVAAEEDGLGIVVHIDGWLGYLPLEAKGYHHRVTFLKGNKKTPSELMPRVHRVVALLKRWILGTH